MPKSRTERPRKTKIGTEVAHVARDSDTTFKVKGQGHQAALLTAVLGREAAATMGVRTCWPWETAATLPSAQPREKNWHRGSPRTYLLTLLSYRLLEIKVLDFSCKTKSKLKPKLQGRRAA